MFRITRQAKAYRTLKKVDRGNTTDFFKNRRIRKRVATSATQVQINVVALHQQGDSPADLAAATNSLLPTNGMTASFGDLPLSTIRIRHLLGVVYSWRSRLYKFVKRSIRSCGVKVDGSDEEVKKFKIEVKISDLSG